MLLQLDAARHASRDQPNGPAFLVTVTSRRDRRGRPQKDINPEWLAQIATMRDKPGISALMGVLARTIRRCMLEYRLSLPGVSFVQHQILDNGTHNVIYNGQPAPPPTLSDVKVDSIVASHLEIFPNFGRSMIVGSLHATGQRITH
jgi:hypothetical protein